MLVLGRHEGGRVAVELVHAKKGEGHQIKVKTRT